ncbi:MAG TPA: A/G-specific adenine glycosylase [Thermoanaerobaculia bacterium]
MTAARLLAWYDRHRRDLPWRRDRDPYRVWLSEVMLQQTRVETVTPYFARFTDRFPDVAALAAADLDEVLALWSGLGYYRRARQLHAAARRVAAAGGFPRTVEGLRELPGVGAYTAAAVASIAFGVVVPVVDGNVERVAARLLALDGDAKAPAARRRIAETAARLLAPERPGDSNQALMELGATVCLPRRPRCLLCPLGQAVPSAGGGPGWPGCRAAAAGDPERFPSPRRRRAVERQRRLVALVEDGAGRLLLFRRPDDARLLAGTWELPWVEWDEERPGEADAEPPGAGHAAALARRYGGRWALGERLAGARHGITFRDIELVAWRASVARNGGPGGAGVAVDSGWHRRAELARLPLSSMVEKVLAAVAAAAAAPAGRGSSPPTRRGGRPR